MRGANSIDIYVSDKQEKDKEDQDAKRKGNRMYKKQERVRLEAYV